MTDKAGNGDVVSVGPNSKEGWLASARLSAVVLGAARLAILRDGISITSMWNRSDLHFTHASKLGVQ